MPYLQPGRLPEAMYVICYILYGVSIVLLLVFMFFVLYSKLVGQNTLITNCQFFTHLT